MRTLQDGTTTTKTFVHTPSTIEAEEAEEIGVEHLLRDIRDVAVGTLSTRITSQLQSLQGLHLRLRDIGAYLQKVIDGDLPVNHAILGNLQDVFNLLPNLSAPKPAPGTRINGAAASNGVANGSVGAVPLGGGSTSDNSELARAMSIKTNDQLMSIYLSSLIRAITAFHDLIENKIQNRQAQEDKDAKREEEKKEETVKKTEDKMVNGTGEGKEKEGGVNGVKKEEGGGANEKGTSKGKEKEGEKKKG